jgi:hypothetical protein
MSAAWHGEERLMDQSLWREVVELAMTREGTYDTQAIAEEIERTFGPSSIREVPPDELERLFHRYQTFGDLEHDEFNRITDGIEDG